MESRPYDLALVGATGFTGGLTAGYLARHAPRDLRWALVGRDDGRLAEVVSDLARRWPCAPRPDVLLADAADQRALTEVARTARVVATTVGPYVLHGGPLVAACVAAGADYLDVTGESEFVDRIYLDHQAEAERKGVRLVHCCGFIAAIEDLGAYFTVTQLPRGVPIMLNGYLRFKLRFSGGSYHSLIHNLARSRERSLVATRRRESEPVTTARRVQAAQGRIRRDARLGGWVVPHPNICVTAVCHTALALPSFGPDFNYGRHLVFGRLTNVAGFVLTDVFTATLVRVAPIHKFLLKLKKAGDGPGETIRAKGWFELVFVGEGGGETVVTAVSGGDPGYEETAKILAESALCLAFDELPHRSGQLTPAVAMGEAILKRLRNVGNSFRTVERTASY